MKAPPDHKYYLAKLEFPVPRWARRLTGEQRIHLRLYGHWLNALATGKIRPLTAAQRRFIAVAEGVEHPVTRSELAWVALRKPKRSPGGGRLRRRTTPPDDIDYGRSAVDPVRTERRVNAPESPYPRRQRHTGAAPNWREHPEGAPRPGWATDSGVREMRRRIRSDMKKRGRS